LLRGESVLFELAQEKLDFARLETEQVREGPENPNDILHFHFVVEFKNESKFLDFDFQILGQELRNLEQVVHGIASRNLVLAQNLKILSDICFRFAENDRIPHNQGPYHLRREAHFLGE